MRKGTTYPSALTGLLKEKYGSEIADIVASPNNVLAVEYIKAIRFLGSSIKPFTVSRMGARHDSFSEKSNISSASFIRYKMMESEDFKNLVPDFVYRSYIENLDSGKISDIGNLDRILLYKLRMISAAELKEVPDVGQGLEYRLKQYDAAASVKKLLEQVKTKAVLKDQNFIRLLGETYEKKLEDNDRPGSCELIVSLNLENHTYKVDQVALLSKKGKVIEKKHLKEAFIPIPKMTFIEALSRSAQAGVELRHENPVLPSGISVKTLESTKKRGYNEK